MNIEYTFEITAVDEAARCMEVVYSSEGRQTMHIGARLPFVGETLEEVIKAYAPTTYWMEQELEVVVPQVGLSGSLSIKNEVVEARTSENQFEAIFPTALSGAIAATVFE